MASALASVVVLPTRRRGGGSAAARRWQCGLNKCGRGVASACPDSRLPTLRCMSAMLSGVILIAALGLIAVLGLVLLLALFLVTRSPAADSASGKADED